MNKKLITPQNKNSFFEMAYPIRKSTRDFSKHEFFVKKAEEAAEFLKKHPFPKDLISNR